MSAIPPPLSSLSLIKGQIHLNVELCHCIYPHVFMLTHVLRNLPPAIHHAWVCSSGSRRYCAVKEMLQNGSPGITLLLENDDLRDVDASSKECCLRIYCYPSTSAIFEHRDHIPSAVRHVTVYANMKRIPTGFLPAYTGLTSVDLSPLSQVTEVQWGFLKGCTGLTSLDLSPLSQVSAVQMSFLAGCTGLITLNLSPLSQVEVIQGYFLEGCTGLAALDLSPLSQVTTVRMCFLQGCMGLTALDLSPLSQVTEIPRGFLAGCTGLTLINLGPLSQVAKVQGAFLTGCIGVNAVDNSPPLCNTPRGWSRVANQWVGQHVTHCVVFICACACASLHCMCILSYYY